MLKVSFTIPKSMCDLAQSPDIEGKAYNICFECPFRGKTCDGPNEQAMSMPERIMWLKRLGKKNGITREKAAEMSKIPLPTINSIMAGRTEDPRHSTMQAISRAYNGGCWGNYPCHIAALAMNGEVQKCEDADYQSKYESAQKDARFLGEQLKYVSEEDEKKVAYLKAEVNELKKSRRVLLGIIFALFTTLLFLLLFDFFSPWFGIFRG